MDLDDFALDATSEEGSSSLDVLEDLTPEDALKKFDAGWYAAVAKRARWMDLIGDYAGSEKFIVDGESLIQHVLDDPLLALARPNEPSFQILHAIHSIELFLENLLKRAAVFDIVFWRDLRHLTIKTEHDNAFVSASRALARSLLFNHITEHADQFGVDVHVFDNLYDAEWQSYQRSVRPMFTMMNDGGAFSGDNAAASARAVLLQRIFIFDLLSHGIAAAPLSAVEFRDTKIFSFVYEQRFDPNARNKLPKPVWSTSSAGLATLNKLDRVRREEHSIVTTDSDDILVPLASKLLSFGPNRDSPYVELVYFFLLHLILLQTLSVADRARFLEPLNNGLTATIINSFFPTAFLVTEALISKNNTVVHVDGHVFVSMVRFFIQNSISSPSESAGAKIQSRLESIWSTVGSPNLNLSRFYARFLPLKKIKASPASPALLPLLPFQNDVFDSELACVHVTVAEDQDDLPPAQVEFSQGTAFVDNKHWHAHHRAILPKHLGGEDDKRLTAQQLKKKLKSEQRFMSNLQRLAATLTGASGARLEPMVIVPVGRLGTSNLKAKETRPVRQQQKPCQDQRGKKSKAAPLSKADKIRQEHMKLKLEKEDAEHLSWWQGHLAQMERMSTRGEKVRHLEGLSRSKKSQHGWLAIEIRLCSLDLEIREWIADPAREDPTVRDKHTLSIMHSVKDLYEQPGLSATTISVLDAILTCLGFSNYIESLHSNCSGADAIDRPLSFEFSKLLKSKSGRPVHKFMHITEDPITWQLRLFGEYMDRSMDSQSDPRVNFKPDAWQREVLDCLDEEKSVLVVAPTSAGKTFISFYAMEQVLRASDDGIIVYVAPTKALVNQVAAEVYARFRKEMNGSTCWAIHTRDYRVHNPQKCQILVTVPEVLAIMLLSPALARNWTGRIKRIILDEIHTIGQQEGGAVWEQIILLSPCPIIGLSATIGEPEAFSTWLKGVQDAKGIPYQFIQHPHRYSHLRKFIYLPRIRSGDSLDSEFKGLDKSQPSNRMRFIHPVSTLGFGDVEMPSDFSMEPADLLHLYEALQSCFRSIDTDLARLDPVVFFSSKVMLRQKDIIRYEAELKVKLSELLSSSNTIDSSPPIQQVVRRIQDTVIAEQDEKVLNMIPRRDEFLNGLLPLLADLNTSGDLPALLFNFDRNNCEIVVREICAALSSSEKAWRDESPEWARKIKQWEKWKSQEKHRAKLAEQSQKRHDDEVDRMATQTEQQSWESYFDPENPSPQFSFADFAAYSKEDLAGEIHGLSWTSTPAWLSSALWRGIGVHHSGLNKKYRALVERLFRVGFLRVVIATGTLALGINAPTKTSIFCGDSPYLTALMYRQCAGRAGRRGYDLLGKVVFYGLPMDRVQRLILSRLPRLTGTFPLSSTLCLRLFNLLHASDHAEYARNAIKSVLRLPQISFGSGVGHEQLLHHLRFSIEYLRRAHLLNRDGGPINLSGVASHLYFAEPSNLALVALLQSGVLHSICRQSSLIQAKRDFIILMCHLFGRRYLPDVYADPSNIVNVTRKSPSIVILPKMLSSARKVLKKHHQEILQIFTSYALTFASQHADRYGPDDQLPLSKTLSVESGSSPLHVHLSNTALRPTARSLFVSNSGHGDNFGSVGELARSARRGIYLNPHAIPGIDHLAGVGAPPALNAYLLDFYMHGQVAALASANGIRRGDVWYLLQDFTMTLMSLRGDLEQLLIRTSQAKRAQTNEMKDGDPDAGEIETESDSGYASFMAGRADVEIEEDDAQGPDPLIPRPDGLDDRDWRVYEVVSGALSEFNEKFRAMWA